MALTAAITFDLIGGTQVLTLSNPSQVEQISFGSNQITFASAVSFTLNKSDFGLYFSYIKVYYTLLFVNFPTLGPLLTAAWPMPGTAFNLTQIAHPNQAIEFTQSSAGSTMWDIVYTLNTTNAVFARRTSPVTITPQEFFAGFDSLTQYAKQV